MKPPLLLLTQSVARRFPAPGSRSRRGLLAATAIAVAAAAAFLLSPALAGVPRQLGRGCSRWIGLAAVLELLSALGFVVFFKLVFGPLMPWRSSSRLGLSVLSATTVLPAGGILGPALGAWVTRTSEGSAAARSRVFTFVLLTNAPNALAVAVVGIALGSGLAPGPHAAALTFLPAAGALVLLGAVASLPLLASPLRTRRPPGAALFEGVHEANTLIRGRDWKLLGAIAYYAFDNAALWAAFRAFGHGPSFGVVVMAYVLGGIGAALPLPAGLGAVEAGLIGTLALYGTPAATAAAGVVLYRGVSLAVPVLLGAGALFQPHHGLASRAGRMRALPGVRVSPRHAPGTRRAETAAAVRDPATWPGWAGE
jgi:uncharacterized membrane protein YbhN (UPF0104 family)